MKSTALSGCFLLAKEIVHFYSYPCGTPLHMGRQPSRILAHARSFAMAQGFVGLDEVFLDEET
jgi:hypothetical protein